MEQAAVYRYKIDILQAFMGKIPCAFDSVFFISYSFIFLLFYKDQVKPMSRQYIRSTTRMKYGLGPEWQYVDYRPTTYNPVRNPTRPSEGPNIANVMNRESFVPYQNQMYRVPIRPTRLTSLDEWQLVSGNGQSAATKYSNPMNQMQRFVPQRKSLDSFLGKVNQMKPYAPAFLPLIGNIGEGVGMLFNKEKRQTQGKNWAKRTLGNALSLPLNLLGMLR